MQKHESLSINESKRKDTLEKGKRRGGKKDTMNGLSIGGKLSLQGRQKRFGRSKQIREQKAGEEEGGDYKEK
jgi:hypothetical protein